MAACTAVCDKSSTTTTPYTPPETGAISCGRMLQMLKGTTGYNNSAHWCTSGCEVLGCPKGSNPWRCIPGRNEVVRKTADGGIACLRALGPDDAVAVGTVDAQACMKCPVAVDKVTSYIPTAALVLRARCTAGMECMGGFCVYICQHPLVSLFCTQPSTRTLPPCVRLRASGCDVARQRESKSSRRISSVFHFCFWCFAQGMRSILLFPRSSMYLKHLYLYQVCKATVAFLKNHMLLFACSLSFPVMQVKPTTRSFHRQLRCHDGSLCMSTLPRTL